MRSFEQQNASVHEILYYHKNSTGIWLEVINLLIILIMMAMMIMIDSGVDDDDYEPELNIKIQIINP